MSGAYVEALKLSNFRCYEAAKMDLGKGNNLIVLTGHNGAGKTNILEALSFLSPGRGLRRAGLGEVTRRGGSTPWAVSAMMQGEFGPLKLGTGLRDDGSNGDGSLRRVVRVDGENVVGPAVLADKFSVSWLTPQMDRLFIEGASSRRRFLDRLMLGMYPDHGRQVSAYERAMQERNRLLADKGTQADSIWLNALEARMAEHGVAVAAARIAFASQLVGQIENSQDGAFPKAQLALDGIVEQALMTAPATAVEDAERERLKAARSRDSRNGRAGNGPHKCDLRITHMEKAMPAELCSTGEQKALLIGLILANAKLKAASDGKAPLMLLDEVVAHLDRDRRAGLFDELLALDTQCWLTGTDRALFEALEGRASFYMVEDGNISAHGL
jgi:DNA replication and repair protein RecF